MENASALAYEVLAAGLLSAPQYAAGVRYNDILVGEYFVDPLVNDVLLIELKTVKAPDGAHRMQCTNYLKAAGQQLWLLVDFDKSCLEIKRAVHGL